MRGRSEERDEGKAEGEGIKGLHIGQINVLLENIESLSTHPSVFHSSLCIPFIPLYSTHPSVFHSSLCLSPSAFHLAPNKRLPTLIMLLPHSRASG